MSVPDDPEQLKRLYLPPTDQFVVIDVPEMQFLMIEGDGDHETDAFAAGTRWLYAEGRSVQIMHVGVESAAVPTMARLHNEFLPAHDLVAAGRHHEIYLSYDSRGGTREDANGPPPARRAGCVGGFGGPRPADGWTSEDRWSGVVFGEDEPDELGA